MANEPGKSPSETSKTMDTIAKTGDGFMNFLSRLGVNPARPQNNLSVSRYGFNLKTRNRSELEAAYRGSWVVGQVIDAFADDMTRAGINITTSRAQANIETLQRGMRRLRIMQNFNFLTKLGRLYGGALLVFQIKGQDLASPLVLDSIGKDQFLGVAVYDRWQLNPELRNTITEGPEIGLPEYYNIVTGGQPVNPDANLDIQPGGTASGQIRVHHSRCVRMVGIELPYFQAITEMMWGESHIERMWDRLISFDDTTLAAANLVDRAQLRMVGIDDLRGIITTGGPPLEGLVQMFEMMRQYQTNEGMTLLDKNDVYSTSTYSFSGLSDVLLQFGQQVAGASGIPLVRLFGQSPAGLSATGEADMRMYYDNINAQQEARLRNPMEVLLQVLYRSLIGETPPDDLEFTFNPLWQMSDLDRANVTKTNTESIIAAHQAGGIGLSTMMKELRQASGDDGIFGNITDEDIAEAEQDEDEPPMPGPEALDPAASSTEPSAPVAPEPDTGPAVKSIDSVWTKMKKAFAGEGT